MKNVQQIDEVPFVADAAFSTKFTGKAFDSIQIDLQGQVDTGGSVTLALGGSHGLLKQVDVKQGSESLLSLSGPTLAFLAAADEAHAETLNPTSTSASNQPFKATAQIDLSKWFPFGTFIDASNGQPEVYMSGRFGAYTDGASSWTTPTATARKGTLRPSVRTMGRGLVGDTFVPRMVRHSEDIGGGPSSSKSFKFTADGPVGGVLMGFIIRTYDYSNRAAGLVAANRDDLVRHITCRANTARSNEELFRGTWGQAKRMSAADLGIKRDAAGLLPAGIVFLRMVDDMADPGLKGGLAMRPGETVELIFDTSRDVEEEFGAAAGTTAATGDQIEITPVYAQRRRALIQGQAAGSLSVASATSGRRRALRR